MSTADASLAEGYRARREARPDDALKSFSEAIEASSEPGDAILRARALAGLGQLARDSGNSDSALGFYRQSVEILRGADGHPLLLAHTIRHQADILRNMERFDEAAALYAEALGLYRGHSDTAPLDLANTLRGYALLKEATGAREEAKEMWREAGPLYEQVGVQAGADESQRRIELLQP